ncbi:hypothetical protein [Candidatus Harpocratesius sp.]
MANVKLSDKMRLDKLQAKITLHLEKKISQQDLLDKCISYSDEQFDDFLRTMFDTMRPTDEIIELIRNSSIKSGYAHPDLSDDELIYGR